jgi:serine/threonine protein kinase
MSAAERGDERTVLWLVDLGASRRATDSAGKTPLVLAVENGHLNVVCRLIHSAADTNARDSTGNTLLMHAIESNRLDIMRYLVDRGADANATDNAGSTPLIYAVMANNVFAVECLIERGADVNATDNEGGTPLTYAVAKDNMNVVRYLVNRGANLETDQGHAQVVEYLLNIVSQSPTQPDGLSAAADDRDAPSYEWKASVGEVQVHVGPEWLQQREELLANRWTCLGAGGFGQVYRAKWLNSNVVVKEVIMGGNAAAQNSFFYSTSSVSREDNQLVTMNDSDVDKFRREANIWYRLNHPHIVQLFGACYGDSSGSPPLFVCEYATNGSLNNYLAANPDQMWHKLYEVALAVQYLHQRGIFHGDLKCNNIVVGSDLKAKVTDFGLSSVLHQQEEDSAQITGAVQWVAPECLGDDRVHATLESDNYSLGMCIIEALRITEIALSSKPELPPYPWGDLDATVVRFRVKTLKQLPSKPLTCTSEQWELVSQMCANDPRQRLQIATVAYVLEGFSKTSGIEPCRLSAMSVQTVWRDITLRMDEAGDLQLRLYRELQDMLAWFDRTPRPRRLVTRFDGLLKHFLLAIDHGFRTTGS